MQIHSKSLNHLVAASKDLKNINLFCLGFLIYILPYTLSTSTFVDYKICQLFQFVGFLTFVFAATRLIEFKFESNYLKIVFFLYCFWVITIIFRGLSLDFVSIKEMLFDAWFGIPIYLAPLILLFPKKLDFYKKLFDVILISGVVYVFYDLIFIKNLLVSDLTNLTSQAIVDYFTRTLAIPCGFIVLTYKYHSKKRLFIVLGIILISVLFAIIRARRALILISITPLIITACIYFINSKSKMLLTLLVVILGFLATIFFAGLLDSKIFDSVKKRGLEDTRSNVEEAFYKDTNTIEWIVGKGIDGKYFCPGIDPGPSPFRETIETDYLQLILKGGLINLLLLLLITIPAAIKGIFYSKNLLSNAAGLWVLLWLLSLYPFNVNTFTMSYLLVWVSVGICYSKTIRCMPEWLVSSYFLKK